MLQITASTSKLSRAPKTNKEWMDAVSAKGFYSKPVEDIKTIRDLNNFVLHWPGKMYRTTATGELYGSFFEKSTNLDVQLFVAKHCQWDVPNTIKHLSLYSKLFLEQSPKKFYEAFDAVIKRRNISKASDLWRKLEQKYYADKRLSAPQQEILQATFAAYRELRQMGYSHFEIAS